MQCVRVAGSALCATHLAVPADAGVTVRRKHVVVDQLDRVGARGRVRVLEAGAGARHHAFLLRPTHRRASE